MNAEELEKIAARHEMQCLGTKGTLLYMFYCICLDECYWTPRQFARQLRG